MPEQSPIRVKELGPRPGAPTVPTDSVWALARLSLGVALLETAWLAAARALLRALGYVASAAVNV